MKQLIVLAVLALLLLGCAQTPQPASPQPGTQTPPAPAAQPTPSAQPAQPAAGTQAGGQAGTGTPPMAPTAFTENDGDSGGDAPNQFIGGPVDLKRGEYTQNAISSEGDLDYYKFTVGAGEWFKLMAYPASDLDAQVLLYTEDGKEDTWKYTYYLVGSTMDKPTFKIDAAVPGKEEGFWSQMGSEEDSYTYYFSVGGVKGVGSYTLTLEVKPQDDGGSGKDAGETPSMAVKIASDEEHAGLLNYKDTKDCYQLSTGNYETVTVTPSPKLDVSFTIHDHGGKDVTWDLTYKKKTDKDDSSFEIDDASAGITETVFWETSGKTAYICVNKEKGDGTYTIKYMLAVQAVPADSW